MAELYQIEGKAHLCIAPEGISILVVGLAGGEYEPRPEKRPETNWYSEPESNFVDVVTERIGGGFHTWNCSARFGGVCCCEKWRAK